MTNSPAAARPAADKRKPTEPHGHQSFWLWVMCLTGVDYFSTLGYQPSIAFAATGRLTPLATIVLVLVTLCCALPVYCNVARHSPHGQGSISMLQRLFSGWTAKLIVLVLLGFAATDYVITQTMSAADAAEHLVHNPFWHRVPTWASGQMRITMFLLVMLGAVFLRGFREVIGVAVVIVGAYLLLNLIVLGSGCWYLAWHPDAITAWYDAVMSGDWHLEHKPLTGYDGWTIVATCLLLFPKLAVGLSGFETGVAVMPLVRGEPGDDPQQPRGRIRHTRWLLITAALIMSVMLLGSALTTSTLIDPHELMHGGKAQNRALAYLAHGQATPPINPLFGTVFGTIYDLSTVAILWFAGASAMSGLLNLVPQYLPRFGMAPKWAEAFRPLVLLFTVINLIVTWIFGASVEAQGDAYATGVLVLMTSASVAVVIERWRAATVAAAGRPRFWLPIEWLLVVWRFPWVFSVITFVFFYTTVAIVIEKPDGIKIAGAFIAAVIVFSFVSRTRRSTELRFEGFDFVDDYSRLLWDTVRHLGFPVLVPHRPGPRGIVEKEEEIRRMHRLGPDVPIVFVEANLGDTSEFAQRPMIEIKQDEGRFVLKLTRCVSIAHALAAAALEISRAGNKPPELHFGWSEDSPLAANLNFVIFGEGNVPWLVRELIHRAEPDPAKRPRVVIG